MKLYESDRNDLLASIRAYGAQDHFSSRLKTRMDILSRASYTFFDINRWISVRVDALSGLFVACVSAYLVYGGKVSAGEAGFTISVVVWFSRQMTLWVRWYNLVEIEGNVPAVCLDIFCTNMWHLILQRTGKYSPAVKQIFTLTSTII